MIRTTLLVAVVTAVVSGAAAQQSVKPHDATSLAQARLAMEYADVQLVGINGQNCPIAVSAERGAPGVVVQTRDSNPAAQNKLYLHFHDEANGILDAAVTLHGSDGRGRMERAGYSSEGNVVEEFHLTSGSGHVLRDTAVSPARVLNVRWVGITELKFADGTSWHSSQTSYCHVQPNGFRLIDATSH